jgi:hypothetical protein
MIRSSNIVFALVFAACVGVPTMTIAAPTPGY